MIRNAMRGSAMGRAAGWLCAATIVALLAGGTLAAGSARAAGGGGGGGGGGADDWSSKPMSFQDAVKAVDAKDFQRAITLLTAYVAKNPSDADAFNYLGFSYRKLKDYDTAIKHYQKALDLDPKHLGANEYLGEAFLETGNLAKAKEQLAKLDNICWMGCKEYRELKDEVKEYEQAHKG